MAVFRQRATRPALFRALAALTLLALAACAPDVVQHNNQGNRHFAQDEYEQALTEYQLAQVEAPDRAAPYYNASNAYNRQGQVEAAAAQAQQALKTADSSLAARTWYNLGNAFFQAERWGEAVTAYQESLRLNPTDLDAKHNLELALQKLEEPEQQQEQGSEQGGEATPTPAGGSSGQEATPSPQPQEGQEATPSPQPQEGQETTPSPQPQEGQEGTAEAGEAPQPTEGMTMEQALQLLRALSQDTSTLQETLQEMLIAPGPAPEQDW